MTREEWLAERRKYVTASDVAAMLGESQYKTSEQLLMEKAGLANEEPGTESMDIALALEPAVLQLARDRFGWDITHNQLLWRDVDSTRLAATPDAIMRTPWGPAVCQVKVTQCAAQEDCRPTTRSGRPSTAAFLSGAPLGYQLQVQAEMACTGLEHGVLLALHTGPLKLRAYYVPRHEAVIRTIRAEAERLFAEVEALWAAK